MTPLLDAHRDTPDDYPLLIKQLLHTALANAPDQVIVGPGQAPYSYRVLRQRIGRLASALAAQGVGQDATVAWMDWDSHRYLEAFFSVPMMGAVLQTVNVRLSPEQILYTLNHAKADVLVVHEDFLGVVQGMQDRLETVKRFVFITDQGTPVPAGWAGELAALCDAASPDYVFPDFDERKRATTFYTTGTTGAPKGVFFSHRQLVLHTLGTAVALASPSRQGRFHRGDVYMPITPMFHVHAWGVPYTATLLGVKQVYPGRYVPEQLLGLIASEKVTFSHCVPTILNMLLSHPAAKDIDLSHWKLIIGGSALPKGLAQVALDRGIDVFTGYGMSETCPILTLAQIDEADLAAGDTDELAVRTRAGRALPLVDLHVVDESGHDLPRDGRSAGEVVVRAPWLTQGYLHNPEATRKLWHGGYLHTQDIGVVDERGYLQITDRLKDVIKSGGEWVSSLEVEDLLSQHPGVAEVAVVGVRDEQWGERPVALVVARPEARATLDIAALRQHLMGFVERGLLSKFGVPRRIDFVEALPKTSVGKLNKKVMREQLGP